ncbi:cell division protein [Vibrio mimicus VM223]|nr:cell division protein [Vibrio mimicus VM223]
MPNREIEVVAKEQEVSDIPYVMQCGAYKTSEQAEARKLDIAFQGISSHIRKKADSSWYRVVLGPYKFKRDAERDKHKLQRAKIEPCAIWKETQ